MPLNEASSNPETGNAQGFVSWDMRSGKSPTGESGFISGASFTDTVSNLVKNLVKSGWQYQGALYQGDFFRGYEAVLHYFVHPVTKERVSLRVKPASIHNP